MNDQIIDDNWDASSSQMSRLYGGSIISSPRCMDRVSFEDDDSFDGMGIGGPALDEDLQPLSTIIFSSNKLTIEDKAKYTKLSSQGENTTVSGALISEIKKSREASRPHRPSRPRTRPNCLFLNHMGSRSTTKSSSSKASMAREAMQAVLDIDIDSDSFCDLPDPFLSFHPTPIPESPVVSSASETTLDASLPTDYFPESSVPSRSTLSSSSSCHHNGQDNLPTEAPQDLPLDDFIGMPPDYVLDPPTDNARAMVPHNFDVWPHTDSPACFPSESPSRRCQVIDVGPPTDLFSLPLMEDPEAIGIGAHVVTPQSRPRIAMKLKKEVPPPRKARPASARRTSSPNTLEAQYWRQASARRYFPRVPSLPFTDSRMQQTAFPKGRAHSYGRQLHRRSGYGLAPMPYAHPQVVSPSPTKRLSNPLAAYPIAGIRPPRHPHSSWQS